MRRKIRICLIVILIIMLFPIPLFAEDDEEGWLAGAIQSEAFNQPIEAKCAIGRIVWEESQRRGISIEELATQTSYLSGWKHGGLWHKTQYLTPLPEFRAVARKAMNGECSSFGARWFDQQYFLSFVETDGMILNEEEELIVQSFVVTRKSCPANAIWDKAWKTTLVENIGEICFYGRERAS